MGNADFEIDLQIFNQCYADQGIEGKKKPSGLSGFRSAKLDADIVIRIEHQKPTAGQINIQPDSALALWFPDRRKRNGSRLRKPTIVALARKLLVAL